MKSHHILLMLLASLLYHPAGQSTEYKISDRLKQSISSGEGRVLIWILLTDKIGVERKGEAVSERSLQRRSKVRHWGNLTDDTDLPIKREYLEAIRPIVTEVRHASRWFNSISAVATENEIIRVAQLPFVHSVDLVARFVKNSSENLREESAPRTEHGDFQRYSGLDYGASYTQVAMVRIPEVHATGNSGQGVMIAVMDNGFRLMNHEVFDSMNVHATYDFVDKKTSVAPLHPGHGGHGISTLSVLGGYKPGRLIGPAFGATYILARTENDSSETPIEEDNWVAAIEWADSIGVDVTSTSLGYLDYDQGWPGWTWREMDGNTTRITRAADMAVAKGIVVVNSAGNLGFNSTRNTLIAPADGDSVLAAGAVTPSGVVATFSSGGPTTGNPPRIKPDVLAPGTLIHSASPTDPTGYATAQGTSFSCPLTAGVVALMLRAFPGAKPIDIIDALKATGNNSTSPDNRRGWGIINAVAAIEDLGIRIGAIIPTTFNLLQNFPNPFNNQTKIRFQTPEEATMTLKVFDLLGREVITLVHEEFAAGIRTVTWNGTTATGVPVATGVYICRASASTKRGVIFTDSRKMILLR